MREQRYVLTWTVYTGPSAERERHEGAFCPAGGLTADEVEAAKQRLYARAREFNIGLSAPGPFIVANRTDYVFDVSEAPMPGVQR